MFGVRYWDAIRNTRQNRAKPTIFAELKAALLAIWNDLPQEFIDNAVLSFQKRLRSCVAAAGGHFEHSVNTKRAADVHH